MDADEYLTQSRKDKKNIKQIIGIRWYFWHFMESVGLISVLRVLRGMKVPKVTAMKGVTRPLFTVTMWVWQVSGKQWHLTRPRPWQPR